MVKRNYKEAFEITSYEIEDSKSFVDNLYKNKKINLSTYNWVIHVLQELEVETWFS
jgi:hypothetical protein